MFFPIKDYNPTKKLPYITIILIMINVLVFVYQSYMPPHGLSHYVNHYSMVPYEVTHFKNVKVLVDRDMFGNPEFQERGLSPCFKYSFFNVHAWINYAPSWKYALFVDIW